MAKKGAEARVEKSSQADGKAEAKEASAKLDKRSGKAKTAAEAEEASETAEEVAKRNLPTLPPEELTKRLNRVEQAIASPATRVPTTSDLVINVTKEEADAVNRYLSKFRDEEKVKKGGKIDKLFLINETGSDRVRWGGVSYRVPEGRNELTDEFIAEHFPSGITRDDLQKGLLGGRVKVETEAPEAEKPKATKKPSRKR